MTVPASIIRDVAAEDRRRGPLIDSLSVDAIKKLPAVSVTVTLECAGNGRSFLIRRRRHSVAGGAVGTAA